MTVFLTKWKVSVLKHEHIVVRLPESESVYSVLGGFPDNVLHEVVVPPAGESIKTTVCSDHARPLFNVPFERLVLSMSAPFDLCLL